MLWMNMKKRRLIISVKLFIMAVFSWSVIRGVLTKERKMTGNPNYQIENLSSLCQCLSIFESFSLHFPIGFFVRMVLKVFPFFQFRPHCTKRVYCVPNITNSRLNGHHGTRRSDLPWKPGVFQSIPTFLPFIPTFPSSSLPLASHFCGGKIFYQKSSPLSCIYTCITTLVSTEQY